MKVLTEILSHQIVYKLGWTLLHLLWQAAVVALLLAILLRLLRKASANLRYTIACSALALLVLAPAITFHFLSAPGPTSDVESIPIAPLTDHLRELADTDMPLQRAAEYMQMFRQTSWTQRLSDFCAPALPYIVTAWLFGVLALSLWHLGGWAQLQRLKRKLASDVDQSLRATFRSLADELKVTRPVRLVESALLQIPTVIGWLRPVILLPASALTGLTTDQLRALLAHELAHIRRHDYLVNIFQTIVEILGFYHPAVWWISRKIRAERENCCDDIAVALCGDTVRYVQALAGMEAIRSGHGEFALAATGGNLAQRISRLLPAKASRTTRRTCAPAIVAVAIIIALAIPAAFALSNRRSASSLPDTAVVDASATETATDPEADSLAPPTLDPGTADILPPRPVADQVQNQREILFDFKIYEIPTNSKLLKDVDKGKIFARSDKAFADELQALSKKGKDVKVLAAPRITALEGHEAHVTTESQMPYTAGYTEQPGKEPKPIAKTVFSGMQLKVVAELVDDGTIRIDLIFTLTDCTFKTHKVAGGREIQIPIVAKTESSMVARVPDGQTILVGGLQDPKNPKHGLILQITPHIVREVPEGESFSVGGMRPARETDQEIIFSVEPQVVTSVRLNTHLEHLSPSDAGPVTAVRELISTLKGQAPPTFEFLELQMTIADQLDDLRRILTEQDVKIQQAHAVENAALVISETLKADDRQGQLLFHLTKQNDKWLIDNIDFEDPQGVKDEHARLGSPHPDETRELRTMPDLTRNLLDGLEYALSGGQPNMSQLLRHPKDDITSTAPSEHALAEVAQTIDNLLAMAKGECEFVSGVDLKTIKHANELSDILADQDFEVAQARVLGRYAIVISKPIKADEEEGQLVFDLRKDNQKWLVEDIDFESPGGVEDEMARFNDRPLKAEPVNPSSTRIGEAVEATIPATPRAGSTFEEMAPRVYGLKYADAMDIASALGKLLTDPECRIVVDGNSNRLIIQADDATRQQIEKLIVALDTASIGETSVAPSDLVTLVLRLKYVDARGAASLLMPTLSAKAQVIANERLNQLIVQATESDLEQIKSLITEIDQPIDEKTAKKQRTTRTEQLRFLEGQRDVQIVRMRKLREIILEVQQKHGVADLTKHHDLIQQRIAGLHDELTKTETRRMLLESELRLPQQEKELPVPPAERLKMRQDYVNNEVTVKALAEKLAQIEMELLLARQTKAEDNPEVKNKANLLKALKFRLAESKEDVARAFDDLMVKQTAEARKHNLAKAMAEMDQNKAYGDRLNRKLAEEIQETLQAAKWQQEVQGLLDELTAIKATYNEINRRIMELKLQPNTPAPAGLPRSF